MSKTILIDASNSEQTRIAVTLNDKLDDFSLDVSTPTAVEFFNATDMSGVQGESGWCRTDVAASFVALDAEL